LESATEAREKLDKVLSEKASMFKTDPPEKEKEYSHVTIEKTDRATILLPKAMSINTAIKWLQKQEISEQEEVGFLREFQFHPNDGLVAMHNVLKRLFGWTEMVATHTFFGKIVPQFITIPVNVDQTVSVPHGKFGLPGVEGFVMTAAVGGLNPDTNKVEPYRFVMRGQVWRRDIPKLNTIADLIQAYVDEFSIYRGKAIDSGRNFIDLKDVKYDDIIFGPSTMSQMQTSIFTPLQYTKLVQDSGIPLKRGILLEGPYGCGKSLTARVTARIAIDNRWTFILGKPQDNLVELMHFGMQYEPACIFVEDVDAEAAGEVRDQKLNAILNTVDGVQSKGRKLMMVLTTNHIEKINRAMLRPGRLDAIIHVGFPEIEAVTALVRKYGGKLLPQEASIEKACTFMHENKFIPATIRETVERAKLFAISRLKSVEAMIDGRDLEHAADQTAHQQKLVNGMADKIETIPIGNLAITLKNGVADQREVEVAPT
jgi:transitional endoplasmic reticulum ATPase